MSDCTRRSRLDLILVERGFCRSRERAQALVLAGQVWSGTQRLEKPGQWVRSDVSLNLVRLRPQYVSRGGYKLNHALETFKLNVSDRICLDIGASTGGFTDCLLQHGARHVFSVDVGHGQLDVSLRNNARVTLLERINARHLTGTLLKSIHPLVEALSLVVADVSFISLSKIIPHLSKETPASEWVLLFKPQFEVGPHHVQKGGIVKDDVAIERALNQFDTHMTQAGLKLKQAPERCPISGKKSGNVEYLLYYLR